MRDIRPDIKERLDAVAKERSRLVDRLSQLDNDVDMLQSFLGAENARWHNREPSLFRPRKRLMDVALPEKAASPVTYFLLETMSDGANWSLGRLKDHAHDRGVIFGDESPGRTLHGGLLGLKKRGVVEMVKSGVWRLVKKGAPLEHTSEAP